MSTIAPPTPPPAIIAPLEADLWWGLMITTVVEVGLEDEDEDEEE